MKTNLRLIALCASVFAIGGAIAADAIKPEKLIEYRQANFEVMAWNMAKIKGMVIDDTKTYNKEQTIAAANAIAAVANSGLGALFAPGTEKSIGNTKTAVKMEFFQKPDQARDAAILLAKESTELAKVAATGDISAIKAQFGKTGSTCKNCHDNFRQQ